MSGIVWGSIFLHFVRFVGVFFGHVGDRLGFDFRICMMFLEVFFGHVGDRLGSVLGCFGMVFGQFWEALFGHVLAKKNSSQNRSGVIFPGVSMAN